MSSDTSKTPHVLQAMADVQRRFSADGLAKASTNTQQGFNFRGIDQLYNVLSTYLVDAQLMIVPHVIEQRSEMHTSSNNKQLMFSIMRVSFTFVSLVDGSTWDVGPFVGEAMDSGDKASNKAMSAAYKYMAIQTFCVPTVGNDDSDADSPELGQARAPEQKQEQRAAAPARDLGPRLTVQDHLKTIKQAVDHTALKHAFALAWKQYEDPKDPKAQTASQLKFKEAYDKRLLEVTEPEPVGEGMPADPFGEDMRA